MSKHYVRVPTKGRYKFKCLRCDLCCGTGPNVALTIYDVVRIAKFLKMHWREFLRNYVKVIIADLIPFLSLKGDRNGKCPFLYYKPTGETVCTIYPVRPQRCKLYPIIVESTNLEYVYLDPKCPGLGEGREVSLPIKDIKEYIKERVNHYRLLYKLIIEEGYEPYDALEKALEKLWHEINDETASE